MDKFYREEIEAKVRSLETLICGWTNLLAQLEWRINSVDSFSFQDRLRWSKDYITIEKEIKKTKEEIEYLKSKL